VVIQRTSLSRLGLQQQDWAADRGQQHSGFIAVEHGLRPGQDCRQHVRVELM
jgi:hypothetical protein